MLYYGNIQLRREQSPVDPCFDLCNIGNGLFCSQEIFISEENSHQLIHALISMISATWETDSCSQEILISAENSHHLNHWKRTLLFSGNTPQRREQSPVDPLETDSSVLSHKLNTVNLVLK
ncbi:hypothetical protein TNIN_68851 [Trichonephila inaurata madagascariensis]|uniref:Uncharacterized protein n=1 Tax=Trichonephila inaurata madagascariensis TaxID=2747483 RepID=A0A8X6YBD8_9ARAC|nr:hypothetical protein TNIN_68851 [Trichonephila inaurata madagascariensis]